MRTSAGVSYCGPGSAAYTPSRSVRPTSRPAAAASARSFGSYASVMSGKRGPSASSFGPRSGEPPSRFR